MGIVVLFIAPGDTSGKDPFVDAIDPDGGTITHGHLREADHHGGPDGPASPPGQRVNTNLVTIGAFGYVPGQGVVPAVAQGKKLTFVNADAPLQIFHTVTACAEPCNGPTGISYPLANGPVDFDSLELGFGPPGVTAASNQVGYTLDTAGLAKGSYAYFCRVHPFMRGEFVVR
jgi:plastocyanin